MSRIASHYEIFVAEDPFQLEELVNDHIREVGALGSVEFVGGPTIKKGATFQAVVTYYFEEPK